MNFKSSSTLTILLATGTVCEADGGIKPGVSAVQRTPGKAYHKDI